MAIAVREWSDESNASARISIGLDANETASKVVFRVLAPGESPWAHTELLGQMVERESALASAVLPEVYAVAEFVVRNDSRIRDFLHIS